MEYRRVWAEISLDNLMHNFAVIRKRIPAGTALMGIVKADAYGHGAHMIARTMVECGADALGVAICEEGIQLRESGIQAPILVMGFTPTPLLPEVVKHNLIQTIFTTGGAKALGEVAARHNKRATVHIEVDTGMSRLGFLPNDEGVRAICEIARNPNLFIEGIYTHFATSDQLDHGFMFEQEARYNWVLDELRSRGLHILKKHMANSGAVTQTVRAAGDSPELPLVRDSIFTDVARVGIMLYGLPPSAEMADACAHLGLKPVMRLMAQVSMVKRLEAGVGISYGHIYKTSRESTIAVLPIGYADGYPRRLSHGGRVLIRGQFAPIAGAICMDQCMADVTDIQDVTPGDPVVLLGSKEEGLCADDLADIVGTISYEIVCGIGKRVPRVYQRL
ncbi:MAG: alanine racemase [Defluviitaleaceae bacterium]|nr:alanine racemase [Defluviitaleaceae bacterium]